MKGDSAVWVGTTILRRRGVPQRLWIYINRVPVPQLLVGNVIGSVDKSLQVEVVQSSQTLQFDTRDALTDNIRFFRFEWQALHCMVEELARRLWEYRTYYPNSTDHIQQLEQAITHWRQFREPKYHRSTLPQ